MGTFWTLFGFIYGTYGNYTKESEDSKLWPFSIWYMHGLVQLFLGWHTHTNLMSRLNYKLSLLTFMFYLVWSID